MKSGQVTIFVIIALILVFSIVIVVLISDKGASVEVECVSASDCVPAGCHATSCVAVEDFSSGDVFCTTECRAGTLDCGFGSCGCVEGKCVAEIY